MTKLRGGALGALIVASMLIAGCETSPPVSSDNVLVFGDSLLHDAAPTVAAGLEQRGWRAVVDGRPGWSIGQWALDLPPLVAVVRPRIAVVVLGTNDCAPECVDVAGGIDRIMATLLKAETERVFWLNVQEDASYPDNPGRVNLELQSAQRRWPRLFLVDLSRTLGGDPAVHEPDGVHFNDQGDAALAALIVETVEQAR